jgi:hypothetical protein
MTNHLSDEAVRVCSDCAEIKPDTKFRRRYRDRPDRMNTCNSCHAAQQRDRRARHRRKRRGMEMQKFATAFVSTRDQKRRQLVFKLAIQEAGGFTQFLKSWHHVISTMISEQRYSPRLLRMYELVFELLREDEERNREALKDLPDEDLQALVKSQVTDVIRQDPQLAVDAMEQAGWTCEPPVMSN